VGDTMLGRLVNEKISQTAYAYPWGNTLSILHKTDLNIVNLEGTFTVSEQKVPKVFNYKADPDKVAALKAARIDVVNLANNHILDFDIEGMAETLETLDAAGILHVGAGMNIDEARMPVLIEKSGITIGIIGYTDNESGWLATAKTPGTNYVKVGDIKRIKKDLDHLRLRADLVIVTMHWGPNMRAYPTQKFIQFAHDIMEAGADIFHGHSSHVFQGVEVYQTADNRKTAVLYDTGDFVDDYAVDSELRNDISFIFLVDAQKKDDGVILQKIRLVPTIIADMQVNVATGKQALQNLELMRKRSEQFGTAIDETGTIHIVG
jgi:poly-gamma-glutamate synthesis protein (capsule biosynthesis protein)